MERYEQDLEAVKNFLPKDEYMALAYYIRPGQEDRDEIGRTIRQWKEKIATMPATYDQDGKGDDAIVHLHYFRGGSDWFITERDKDGNGTEQAFGFCLLNGDLEMAELGYVSIDELTQNGVELDLYWTPKTLGEIKRELRA
jgi:hypothetical protein